MFKFYCFFSIKEQPSDEWLVIVFMVNFVLSLLIGQHQRQRQRAPDQQRRSDPPTVSDQESGPLSARTSVPATHSGFDPASIHHNTARVRDFFWLIKSPRWDQLKLTFDLWCERGFFSFLPAAWLMRASWVTPTPASSPTKVARRRKTALSVAASRASGAGNPPTRANVTLSSTIFNVFFFEKIETFHFNFKSQSLSKELSINLISFFVG